MANGVVTFNFVPPLTTAEEATFARIVAMSRGVIAGITSEEWAALEPSFAQERTFRQQSQSEFIAKTQNARDRELFDTLNAVINELRALRRD